MTEIFSALGIQFRTIRALILREALARFNNLGAGYLWAFVPPLAQVATLYLVWTLLSSRHSAGFPLALFLITGVLPFYLFRQSLQQGINSIKKGKGLTSFPQVKYFDVIMASVVLEFFTSLIVFLFAVWGAQYLGETAKLGDPFGVLIGYFLIALLGMGSGMIVGSLSVHFKSAPQVAQIVLVRPLFFISGLFFSMAMLPVAIRDWLQWNPLLHAIEFIRVSFFFDFQSSYYDLGYAAIFALVLFTFGHAALVNLVNDADRQ